MIQTLEAGHPTHQSTASLLDGKTLTTRYFSDPPISTEFTTLIGFVVCSYALVYLFPENALNNEVLPDPAAPHT